MATPAHLNKRAETPNTDVIRRVTFFGLLSQIATTVFCPTEAFFALTPMHANIIFFFSCKEVIYTLLCILLNSALNIPSEKILNWNLKKWKGLT